MGMRTGRRRVIAPSVIWLTGLSGSGKSTLADRLAPMLREQGADVEQLDGDRVREVFPQTGFSREDRGLHIRRMGYVASLLEKHGVTVIASFISPYASDRRFVRKLCRRFVEVHVSTPLEVCEERDVRGLYRKARAGLVTNFTGVSDPYEPPRRPAVKLDTSGVGVEEACRKILAVLPRQERGRRCPVTR
jgi:adenylylsulfate kinase